MKRRQILKCLWWGIIHIERSSESFEELTFLLQKFIKPPDRWLIEEWMIGNSFITNLSCNRPRTWKGYKPHKHQSKRVDKMPTYLNYDGIVCYRHGTCELYRHCSNCWSTTKYLAVCSGWAKVKLGGFVGWHYCIFRTTNYSPKTGEINKLWHMYILWPCSTCFRRNMFCRTHSRK
jgi:hypothetical protein